MSKKDPVLYILMRTDMDSMNPGKAVAQGCHAANAFMSCMKEIIDQAGTDKESLALGSAFTQWEESGGGFGTTIVLDGVDDETISSIVDEANDSDTGAFAGVVYDTSYPVKDGKVTHLINIMTCGYIFVPDRNAPDAFKVNLELHR